MRLGKDCSDHVLRGTVSECDDQHSDPLRVILSSNTLPSSAVIKNVLFLKKVRCRKLIDGQSSKN